MEEVEEKQGCVTSPGGDQGEKEGSCVNAVGAVLGWLFPRRNMG